MFPEARTRGRYRVWSPGPQGQRKKSQKTSYGELRGSDQLGPALGVAPDPETRQGPVSREPACCEALADLRPLKKG